jgi:hypothetical protein
MAGIACLVICAICLFAAMERYNSNAANVNAMNAFRQSSPLRHGLPSGLQKMKPATPAAIWYTLIIPHLSNQSSDININHY